MENKDLRELIIKELKANSFNTTDQAGNKLIVVEECDYEGIAEAIVKKINKGERE